MTFYYSIKQMRRSPLKSILFFLLIAVCAFFLALGGSFWYMGSDELQGFDEKFTTIGTVEQKYEGTETGLSWNPEKQAYEYYSTGYFGEWIDDNVLADLGGVDYILEPKQRPYYGAYIEDLYDGIGSPNWGLWSRLRWRPEPCIRHCSCASSARSTGRWRRESCFTFVTIRAGLRMY